MPRKKRNGFVISASEVYVLVCLGKAGQKNRGGSKWKLHIGAFDSEQEDTYAICVIAYDSNEIKGEMRLVIHDIYMDKLPCLELFPPFLWLFWHTVGAYRKLLNEFMYTVELTKLK